MLLNKPVSRSFFFASAHDNIRYTGPEDDQVSIVLQQYRFFVCFTLNEITCIPIRLLNLRLRKNMPTVYGEREERNTFDVTQIKCVLFSSEKSGFDCMILPHTSIIVPAI
jgi:hypothetical protein